ncbi:hypothetical protein HK103_001893 [Boothiomyces macroporosus]|uniref:Uncharacterized protein n=1 Tax=Boothiomyces macroporosus TaxID=261099 RepID=A0AAD5Y0B1_9FUNG|nr:hypothetical protein HK103_001893 [Boothiomyces macroporosus]
MGPFTQGYTLNSLPYLVVDYTTPLAIIAMIVSFIYLFAFAAMLVFIARGWGVKSKVLFFVWMVNVMGLIWAILNIVSHVPIVTPFSSWLYNVMGELDIYVTVLGQLDILKAFSTGTIMTKERITYFQYAYTIYNVITMFGLYASVGYLGVERPAFLDKWDSNGYIAFAILSIVYETFHAVYVAKAVVWQIEKRREIVNTTGVVIDWTAVIIWLASWFVGGSTGVCLAVIGSSIGTGHILFLTVMFKMIRVVNLKSSGSSSSHVNNSSAQTHTNQSTAIQTGQSALFHKRHSLFFMGPFTTGYTLSSLPLAAIDYSSPLAGVRQKVLYFIWIVNGMAFIWSILNIIVHIPIVCPFTSWLFNVFGELNIFLTVIGQLDILKAFSTGTSMTAEKITYFQYGYTVYNIITMFGLYMTVGYLGTGRPSFVDNWNTYGYIAFAIASLAYETFHAVFVARAVVHQIEKRKEMTNTKGSADTSAFYTLYRLVITGVAIDWTAAIIWVLSWFLGGEMGTLLA